MDPTHYQYVDLVLDRERLTKLAKQSSAESLIRGCQIILGAQQALRQGVDPQLQLELALIRMADA